MENRLATKMDASTKAVNEAVSLSRVTNDALGALEEKVESNEAAFKQAIKESKEGVRRNIKEQVKDMVNNELRSAGFDPKLSAADLRTQTQISQMSYAGALARGPNATASTPSADPQTQAERREERFWECRRSLRLWPIAGASREGLTEYLSTKLHLDKGALEEIGEVTIKKFIDPAPSQRRRP